MRLVDADELRRKFYRAARATGVVATRDAFVARKMREQWNHAISLLDDEPTVECATCEHAKFIYRWGRVGGHNAECQDCLCGSEFMGMLET